MLVTFCGHSQISDYKKIELWLTQLLETLIKNGATHFYLGGYGAFDNLVGSVLTSLKTQYPHIERILVLPYLNRYFDENLYDSSYYPSLETVPKKFAISKRNEAMVQEADIIIAYITHSWGGASTTFEFAKRKKKIVINYPDFLY